MPLKKDKSDKSRSYNIGELISSGRPAKQAAAIAYDVQREAKKRALKRLSGKY